MVAGILYGKKTAHQLSNDDGRGLEDLVISGGLTGHTENGAQLVFNDGANFITGNIAVQCLFYSLQIVKIFLPAAERKPREEAGYAKKRQKRESLHF